jgi:ppGpp synthetase/RelA/SpoT-type nucleotidyltranferase
MNHKIDYKYYREISNEISNELNIFNKIVVDLNKIKNIETIS